MARLQRAPKARIVWSPPAFCSVRLMKERLTTVSCAISNRPVRLDECELNPLEEPAHEACLAERRKEEINKRKAALESK